SHFPLSGAQLMARRPSARPTMDQLAFELRAELRSILRQFDELRRPISQFARCPDPGPGQPPFCVLFDNRPHRRITGMRTQMKKVELPDERIVDAVLSLAKSIWHLKDRLHQWVRAHKLPDDVKSHAEGCPALLIAADLANWKKHGRSENVSGQRPRPGLVEFDTSQSGVVEFFYNGATKEKELLVTNPEPIKFTVPVLTDAGDSQLGDAVEMLAQAFEHWKPLIRKVNALGDMQNPETRELARRLFPSEDDD
ncbi:MAG: hypothetical protein KJ749_13965, partial [Planctomycetes bacterium]|nr:hypothetical protein [Planctomycetota bacterium]